MIFKALQTVETQDNTFLRQLIDYPTRWIVKLPQNLSLEQSMIYGTAGYTAAWSIYKLLQNGLHHNVGRDILQTSPKPLLKPQWAAVVDTVGGESLISALKSVQYAGSVTTCGTVSGTHLETQVFPFIFRGELYGRTVIDINLSIA